MASLLLAAGLLASLSAPRLDLYRSRSVPWVGQRVSYEAAVQGAAPGTPWRISVGLADGGESARIAGDTLTADDRGAAVLEADYTFARAGWYDLRALAVHEDQRLEATLRVPVTAYRVDFAWYQAEKGHELRWPTIQLTAGPDDAEYWQRRGVLPARWCGAMCGKDKPMEHFVRGWTSKPAIAIDEFGGSAEYFPKFHQALTEARKLRPDEFIAVWFCGWYDFWPKLRDLVDFFLPEIYLNYTGYSLTRFDSIVAHARECGVFEKTLIGLGINVVKRDDASVRYSPTPDEIVEEVRYLKQIAPDLRGLAFFTYGSAERGVRAAVDTACRDYFLVPVADLVDAQGSPPLADPGEPVTVTARLRNAGAMPGRGFTVLCACGDQQARATLDLAAGAERDVELTLQPPPGAGEITVTVEAPPGGSLLRERCTVPYARLASPGPIVAIPPVPYAAPAGPFWLFSLDPRPPTLVTADAGKPIPVSLLTAPDGANVLGLRMGPRPAGAWTFLQPARESVTALTNPLVHTESLHKGRLRIVTAAYEAILAPAEDALVSLRPTNAPVELLASPWRMSWDSWRGFGEPEVKASRAVVSITVPVSNDLLEGWSWYVFHPDAIEIRRAFRARDEALTVEKAGEGALVQQREGTYALQHGVGARPSRGILQVGDDYRDLYFGSPSLDPDAAERGGWFDFSWTDDTPAGLGVALAEQWEQRASSVGYDVTRYYDAADWLEVAYVWGGKALSVKEGSSRLFLLPHGPLNLTDPQVVSPARALWERLRAPARQLSRLSGRG